LGAMAIAFIHCDLVAWREAMKLVEAVYWDTEDFPRKETFGLTAQIGEEPAAVAKVE